METATSPEVAKSPVVEWISKEEAGKALDKSRRTIENMVERGLLRAQETRSPKTGHKVQMIHAGDVARLQHQAENPETAVVVAQRGKQAIATLPLPQASVLPATPRPWLTLDEAADHSGLTKRWLLQEAESTVLGKETAYPFRTAVRDMGKHAPGGRWRFHRESLEKA